MIKIGDFARLSHLSVATLRHYDEIGLLKPVAVDAVTAYRYYAMAQLPHLNRIVALKDLGFSLDQIHRLQEDGLPIDRPIPDSDLVTVYTLPPARVVSVVHHHREGPDFTLGHAAILSWMEASHHRSTGPYREVYINYESAGDKATEIQYPIEGAAQPAG